MGRKNHQVRLTTLTLLVFYRKCMDFRNTFSFHEEWECFAFSETVSQFDGAPYFHIIQMRVVLVAAALLENTRVALPSSLSSPETAKLTNSCFQSLASILDVSFKKREIRILRALLISKKNQNTP